MSNSSRKTKKAGSTEKWRKFLLSLGWIILIGAGIAVGVLVYVSRSLPAWDPQQLSGARTTILYDDKGQVCAGLHAGENRTEISLDKIPPDLINAFVATEDRDFYHHHGINFKGIVRAVFKNVQSGDLTSQGASTITQQLARSAFLSSHKHLERKLKEVVLAFKLESKFSKDEIMRLYLNKIYFGGGSYGVQAAANTFFGKDANQLTLEESALLAGLVQSPNNYNPFQFYDRAKARQKIVLDNMADCGFIDSQTAQAAYDKPLHFKKAYQAGIKYGFFTDAVIEEALHILENIDAYDNDPNNAIYRSGLKIYTTMNSQLQEHAETVFSNPDNFPKEKKKDEIVQAGMAVIDPGNGEVKAIMGGRQYEQQRGFNRATSAYRQPGSSIKPLAVYGPALEQGYMPFFVLDDKPITYKMGGSVYSPTNYDGVYRGLIPMRTGVQLSINSYAVQLLDKIGINSSFKFARSLGLELNDSKGRNDLGLSQLALGGLTNGVTPLQMASAYGAFANSGIYVKPYFITRIEDANGVIIYKHKTDYQRVMTEETAWLMTNLLQTVVSSGTGTRARVPGVMTAGKTGTTEKNKDIWFCGYIPGFAGAVWMGYDQKDTMRSEYGGGYPAIIWRSMMQKAAGLKKASPQPKPPDIIQVSVCSKSGKSPSESCPPDQIITEYCVKEFAPQDTCEIHNMVYICPESGKLAGKYCPHPVLKSMVKLGEEDADADKIPTEQCDIHVTPTIQGIFKDVVYICRDPRNGGELYRANIPNPTQTGGCPQEYLEEMVLQPGEDLPNCPIEEHQLKAKKAREIVKDIINN